jgi:hypothetical protein
MRTDPLFGERRTPLSGDRDVLSDHVLDGIVTACIVAKDNRTIVAGVRFGRVHFLQLVDADER